MRSMKAILKDSMLYNLRGPQDVWTSKMVGKARNDFRNVFGSKFMTKNIPKFERDPGNDGPHGLS